MKETNDASIQIDAYCCKIIITRPDKIGSVTVDHMPRELSRYVFYFVQDVDSVNGTVANVNPRVSPMPEGD